MLGDISAASEIYLVCGYTDMRKSIDGLRAIVEGTLKLDSKNHSLFLFCGRRCDRIKALIWEGDGYVLLYKRLDVENGRYRWPRDKSEARNLTWQQFDWLMSGIDIEQPTAIRIKRPCYPPPKPLKTLTFLDKFSWKIVKFQKDFSF